jgi:hypothetical protein
VAEALVARLGPHVQDLLVILILQGERLTHTQDREAEVLRIAEGLAAEE